LRLHPAVGTVETLAVEGGDPWVAEIAYFADCVESGTTPETATGVRAREALRVALAVNTYTGDAETPEQRAAFVEQIRAIPTRPRKPGSGSASRPTRTCCPPPRSGLRSSTRLDIRGCR
jgi:hypothetical protein